MKAFALIKRFLALEGIYGPEPGCGFSMFSTPFFSPGGGSSGSRYSIANSVRLRASASAYFSRTPGSAGDRKKWTYSGWVKRGVFGSVRFPLMDLGTASSDTTTFSMGFWNTGTNDTFFVGGGVTNWRVSNALYRDPTAHYHVVVAIDTANATADDRIKVWINGVQITSWATNNAIGSSADTAVNQSGVAHYIGRRDGGSDYADGVLSDVHFVGGQALSASDFGETNADGVWVPKSYTGTYAGTNSFHLNFADAAVTAGSNAGLGKDTSGNGNYWVTNNISVTAGATYDALVDTPTNNFCVLNPLVPVTNPGTLSNGNMKYSRSASGTGYTNCYGTMAITNALAYFEVSPSSGGASNNGVFGVAATLINSSTCLGWAADQWGWEWYLTKKVSNATETAYGTTAAAGDILRCAVNTITGKIWFGNASGWFGSGDPAADTNPTFSGLPSTVFPGVSGLTGTAEFDVNFGQRPFAYTPPSGFKSLCTANLPSVAITNPSVAFKVTLATESNIDSAVATARSGWTNYVDILKNRTAGAETWAWRFSHDSGNEYSISASSVSRAANRTNSGTDNWVGYSLRIGSSYGTAAGSVSHTNGADTTVTHSVGVSSRQAIFLFPRTSGSTVNVHHADLTSGNLLNLCAQTGQSASSAIKSVTSTAFTINTSMATGTYDYLVISEVPGFVKLGKYTGNGLADGPNLASSQSPAAIISKVIGATDHWSIYDTARDTYNEADSHLYMDTLDNESTSNNRMDILGSGHKIRTTGNMLNYTVDHAYISIAEHPFGGSNVSPAPAR